MAEQKNNRLAWVNCPQCQGATNQTSCSYCGNTRVVGDFSGQLLYWGKALDLWHVAYDRTLYWFKKTWLLIILALSLASKFFGFIFIYHALAYNSATFKLLFFTEVKGEILLLWVSFALDIYIFYYLTLAVEQKVSLTKVFNAKRKTKQFFDIAKYFNYQTIKATESAWRLADKYQQSSLMPFHLFAGLLDTTLVKIIFTRLGVDYTELGNVLARQFNKKKIATKIEVPLSETSRKILTSAFVNAWQNHQREVDEMSLLVSIVDSDEFVKEVLYELGIDEDKLVNMMSWVAASKSLEEGYQNFRYRARLKPKGRMDRAMTALETPTLDRFSTDLTRLALSGHLEMLVGRVKEQEQIFRVLESGRDSVVLIGPPGVGKTAIIAGIAQRMVAETVPEFLQDKRLISLNAPRLISGVSPSEAAERLIIITDEITRAGNIVLVIENVNALIGISTGNNESLDLADVLADIVSRHLFMIIATSEPLDYTSQQIQTTLSQIFRVVPIAEPAANLAIQILEAKTLFLEYKYKVFFLYDAIAELTALAYRYLPEKYMPKKAIELLEEIALIKAKEPEKNRVVRAQDVAVVISEKIKIPVSKVGQTEAEKLLNLEDLIHEKLIDQTEAVQAVAEALRRARTVATKRERTIANFLFLGPTGVGKTELAKTVAEIYFGSRQSMIRLDMSEYQDVASLAKLIGASGMPGYLSKEVSQKPFSILLLDELEKAHLDVLNIFLQVMDDGRLTDGTGRVIDFTNIILIATSNAGSQFIRDEIKRGTSVAEITQSLLDNELKNYYHPEFLNRFDGVIVFKPLSIADVKKIAGLMVADLTRQLEEEKGIQLKIEDEALNKLATAGYQPEFGARPMRRAIQNMVDNPLAKLLLQQQLSRRDTIVYKPSGNFEIIKGQEL